MQLNRIALSLLSLAVGLITEIRAQSNVFTNRNWTWISGSNAGGFTGSFGTRGVESASNRPPARVGSSMVYHPETNSIYMGYGAVGSGLADFWRFNLTSNRWTWLAGSSTQNAFGVYGTRGVAASTTYPGTRYRSSMVIGDNGQIYIFGGSGFIGSWGYLNDLWQYNIATNWYTWLTGSNTLNNVGSYGTQSVEASSNVPGARHSMGVVYHSRTTSIYVYGGNNGAGLLNDFWRYNITSGMWAWIGGSSTTNQNAVFNTINVESSTTNPGAAEQFGMVIIPNTDIIYQFGSYRYILGASNALFRYNITSGRFAWISGASTANPTANYGTMNVEAPTNVPPPKFGMVMVYHPSSNNILIHGGDGNDLWRFNITSNMWAMIHGTSAALIPNWGTLGISASTNLPGARRGASGALIPSTNTLYYFGGQSNSGFELGDLWQYIIDSAPEVVITSTTTSTTTTTTATTTTTTSTSTSDVSTSTSTVIRSSSSALADGVSSLPSSATTTLSVSSITSTIMDAPPLTTSVVSSSNNDVVTAVEPVSTSSPIAVAPGSTLNSSIIVFASAGGGGALLLIGIVAAVVVFRRRSSAKKQNIYSAGQDYPTYAQTGLFGPQIVTSKTQLGVTTPQHSMLTMSNVPQQMTVNGTGYQPQLSTSSLINPSMTMGRQSMYVQNPMIHPSQQSTSMLMNTYGMGTPPSPGMQPPASFNGQGAGTIIVDDNDQQVNYNQFQY